MSDIGESSTTTEASTDTKKSIRPSFRRSQKISGIQTVNEILHGTPDDLGSVIDQTPREVFQELSNTFGQERVKKSSQLSPSKVLMGLFIFLLLIAGFWGRPVVSALGIPVDPAPYSALYFEDPHVAITGVKPGSVLSFGINNGSPKSRDFKWEAKVESRPLKKGTIKLGPYQRITLKVKVTSGKPMEFVAISVNTLSSPIGAVVTA